MASTSGADGRGVGGGVRTYTIDHGVGGGVRTYTIDHDGVRVSLARGGRGRVLVFCPGLSSTQAELHEQQSLRGTASQVLLTAQQILEQPGVNAYRLDAGHGLVLTHAPEIAEIIRGTDGSSV